MGLLEKALPRAQQTVSAAVTINSPKGIYRAYFIGMEQPFEWVSDFAADKCRLCAKNPGLGYNGEGVCSACNGTKRRTELHTKLRYHLENGALEEEEVNFKIAPPGMSKDGNPLSPSTLFLRLRTLSNLPNASEKDLDDWYTGLTKPIKIPCQVIIGDNQNATALKITEVILATARAQQPPHQRQQPPEHADVPAFDPEDWESLPR